MATKQVQAKSVATLTVSLSRNICIILTTATLGTLSACSDPYAERFTHVSVGDSRAQVVNTMGSPTNEQNIAIPLLSGSQLTWKAYPTGITYQVVIIVDRVAIKTTLN
jgi:hypothetical protein